jgi:lysozyme
VIIVLVRLIGRWIPGELAERDDVGQNQFDALVCFSYNVGLGALKGSTLLKKLNANPKDPTIRDEFLRWNKAAGRVMRGLTKRRAEEADLYFKP